MFTKNNYKLDFLLIFFINRESDIWFRLVLLFIQGMQSWYDNLFNKIILEGDLREFQVAGSRKW